LLLLSLWSARTGRSRDLRAQGDPSFTLRTWWPDARRADARSGDRSEGVVAKRGSVLLYWAVLLVLQTSLTGMGIQWVLRHRSQSAEMLRDLANRMDPIHLSYSSTCTLQGQIGNGDLESDWADLARANANDWNSETYVVAPGAIQPGAPLRLRAGF